MEKFFIISTLIATTIFASGDRDSDGYLNTVEVDDDGDRIPDCIERKRFQKDSDNDGSKNGDDADDDGDGINDKTDANVWDKDNDGVRNDAETKLVDSSKDDDADGVRDRYEKPDNRLNHDNDSKLDDVDSDDDADGQSDATESDQFKRNHDNDDRKDKRDLDDDNDGIADLTELNCQAIITPTVPTRAWTAEQLVANGSGAVGHGLAVDSANGLHAVWTVTAEPRLYINYGYSQDQGATWTLSEDVTDSTGAALGGNIAVGPDDAIHLAYNVVTSSGKAVYYKQRPAGATVWSESVMLTNNLSIAAATPTLTVDTSGTIHVAWHSGDIDSTTDYTKIFYTQSTNQGDSFAEPVQLNTNTTGHAAWPRFTIQGDGQVVAVAWRDNRAATDWDVYVAVSTDAGQTFVERVGMATSQIEWDPDILVDRFGNLQLSIMVYDTDGISIYYSRSSDFGVTWTTPLRLSDYFSRFPSWVAHPNIDVLWLFWKDERDRVDSTNVQADVSGKYSLDGGITWSNLDRATDQGTIEVKFPSVALGPDGTPYVLWSDERSGSGAAEQIFISIRS